MPNLDDPRVSDSNLRRELLYGPSQTKKTFWAGMAAEAGFNVLLLNGDGNFQILKNLTPAAQKRVRVVQAFDKLGSPQFATLCSNLFKADKPVLWDDTQNCIVYHARNVVAENYHYWIDFRKMTPNDVIVLDSWTAFVASTAWDMSNSQGVDLSDGSKMEWDLYGPTGRLATWLLQKIGGLPCHLIVIGHDTMWERRKGGKGADKNDILETRRQLISTSGNQAKVLPKYFTDTLYFSVVGTGMHFIDGQTVSDREGGSRTIPEKRKWEEFQFIDLIKKSSCILPTPDAPMPGCVLYAPGEIPDEFKPAAGLLGNTATNKVLSNSTATAGVTVSAEVASKPKGLAALGIKLQTPVSKP